jgi:acetyl esterase/lipase
MARIRILLLLTLIVPTLNANAQKELKLYKSSIPNSKVFEGIKENTVRSAGQITRVSDVTEPVIYTYLADEKLNTGKAIVICPGGGYGILAIDHEGHDVAKRFAAVGISAFVLKYRLPSDKIMIQKDIGPLQDAQRAIQLVREHAKEWKINPNQIGVAGFSAGGHLASTLGTHFEKSFIANPENINLRPDFMLLMYPVISMKTGLTHEGSKQNLLGKDPSSDQVLLFSNEEQVRENTPPAFLVHAEDDSVVLIANSTEFRSALEKYNIPTKLLTYPKGGHGFGLNNPTSDVQWFDLFVDWLQAN